MFTGLIEEIGMISGRSAEGGGLIISVSSVCVRNGLSLGDSVAINGACQTVTKLLPGGFDVFASRVTLGVTTIDSLAVGCSVNLERALRIDSRLGGHIVQGHVDGRGKITRITADAQGIEFEVQLAKQLSDFVVTKGSVAVDGVSLTVAKMANDKMSLYCIPETIERTTLSRSKIGDSVNIETDILGKYVAKMLGTVMHQPGDSELLSKLTEEGFI